MLYHAGPSSLVFFAECLKIITDSNLQIQSYKIQVQIKPKLHQLWRIALWLSKFHLSVFVKIVWVFWLEHVVPSLEFVLNKLNSLWRVLLLPLWEQIARYVPTEKPMSIGPVNMSVFSPIGACIRNWCTAGAVERRSQMFVYRRFRFSLSLPKACSQARRIYICNRKLSFIDQATNFFRSEIIVTGILSNKCLFVCLLSHSWDLGPTGSEPGFFL